MLTVDSCVDSGCCRMTANPDRTRKKRGSVRVAHNIPQNSERPSTARLNQHFSIGTIGIDCPVLRVPDMQGSEHRWIGSHLLGFQPIRLNCCPSGNEEPYHFALPSPVSGGRVEAAVNCPSQRRR